jgi:bifunctional non-homologous end joining protein LigD
MVRTKLPDWIQPQLATLAETAPAGDDWLHEIKYDGYRLLAWIDGTDVRLMTRNQKDWTDRFPAVVEALASLGWTGAVADGEVGVELADGRTSFQALQNVLGQGVPGRQLRFWIFDLLYMSGRSLVDAPLSERKQRLRSALDGVGGGLLRYSEHVEGRGPAFHAEACSHGLEGIISKRASAPYRGGRGTDWRKVKCLREQEFVVGGYTAPGGSRKGLGALHVGSYEGDRLIYRGKVGTGYTEATLRDLVKRLKPLRQDVSPFADGPRGASARASTWVEPVLVAQIRYTEITDDGRLRHPVYLGLREDKAAPQVSLEVPAATDSSDAPDLPSAATGTAPSPAGTPSKPGRPMQIHGVRISSPDKILYPEVGVTKLDLIRYYESVEGWILPHLARRPLTLVRCPAGHGGNCFFQKHFDRKSVPAALSLLTIEERDGPELYGILNDLPGILSLVQLGALELHTWNSKADRVERPDRFTIDLDPDPGVAWDAVVDSALHVREVLQELGLESFIKTTGGKGLHVVVPIDRRTSWDDVKAFSGGIASLLSRAAPELYTTEMLKAKRKGRILIDYLRNARGATAIEAYSTRARAGAPVAAPIHWDELADGVRANTFTVRNMSARVRDLRDDPWSGMAAVRQSITAAMRRRLGVG